MKSFARLAGFSLTLVVAGLGSGCATSTPTATYQQPAQDFEVVESSTDRPLTDLEKAEVRASVASYLDREGVSDGGDYFLKVYLTPENMDAESEWVVVRFTRYTAQRVAVVSSYPYDNFMYSSYYPYYAYDVYPYGYGCVARISFQYYVDPFYHRRHYYYRGHGGYKRGHHDTAHNHGGKPHSPGGEHGSGDNKPRPNRPSGTKYTGHRSPSVPLNVDTPARYHNRNNPNAPVARQDPDIAADAGQQRNNPGRQWRGRPGTGTTPAGVANNPNRPEVPNGASNPNSPVAEQNSDASSTVVQRGDTPSYPRRGRPGTEARGPDIANNGHRPEAPGRITNPKQRPPGYHPVGSTAATPSQVNNPSTHRRNERTDPRPTPSRINNPTRTEANAAPSVNRPAPSSNRPAPAQRATPTASRPAPSHTRPAPSVQPPRAPAPSYQPQQQPVRSAPSSASRSERGESRRTENGQREAMR